MLLRSVKDVLHIHLLLAFHLQLDEPIELLIFVLWLRLTIDESFLHIGLGNLERPELAANRPNRLFAHFAIDGERGPRVVLRIGNTIFDELSQLTSKNRLPVQRVVFIDLFAGLLDHLLGHFHVLVIANSTPRQ